MGLFDFFGNSSAKEDVVRAMERVMEMVRQYRENNDINVLYEAARVCRQEILVPVKRYNLRPTDAISITIEGQRVNTAFHDGITHSLGQILFISYDLPPAQKNKIDSILGM